LHPGLSRLRVLHDHCEFAASGAGSDGGFNAENSAFLLVSESRRVNHHVVEQAPGDGRFIRRPLLGADGFVFNTYRRRFEAGSNGQEKHAGLALLDGVMDQLHKRGTTAVQPTLRSNQEQHEATDGVEQPSASYGSAARRPRIAARRVSARLEFPSCQALVEESPLSGIVPRQRGRRQRRKQFQKSVQEGNERQKTLQVGGAPLTIATGALFSLGPT